MFQIRTIDEIFQELLREKQLQPHLSSLMDKDITDELTLIPKLNDGSAPDWVLWLSNMAVSTHLTDIATKTAIDEMNLMFAQKNVHDANWYIRLAKAFQYGDTPLKDSKTGIVYYETINEINKIIQYAVVLDLAGEINIKVRRKDTDILTTDELNAFQGYLNMAKSAGDNVRLLNYPGDLITLNMNIRYNPNISLNVIKANVNDTINSYLEELPFNSKIIISELISKLRLIEGVLDPQFISGIGTASTGQVINFQYEYTTQAGWGKIDPNTPLSDTINYIV